MMQTLLSIIALSLSLIAFCSGAWLTLWATENAHSKDLTAAKLTGYFVSTLAMLCLVCSSYFVARALFMPTQYPSPGMMMKHQTKKQGDRFNQNKPQKDQSNKKQ